MWVRPEDVKSPKERLRDVRVIHSGEPGEPSLARGTWDDVPNELLLRWNGTDQNSLGFPSAFGYPTWYVLPENLVELIQGLDQDEIRIGDKVRVKGLTLVMVVSSIIPDTPSGPLITCHWEDGVKSKKLKSENFQVSALEKA